MEEKKVIYIVGNIKGADRYWEAYEKAEDDLTAEGFIPLSPSRLPYNLSDAKMHQLQQAMMQTADAVLFLPEWNKSTIGQVEMCFCKYLGKPYTTSIEELKEVLA
jgi:hypothetical protein